MYIDRGKGNRLGSFRLKRESHVEKEVTQNVLSRAGIGNSSNGGKFQSLKFLTPTEQGLSLSSPPPPHPPSPHPFVSPHAWWAVGVSSATCHGKDFCRPKPVYPCAFLFAIASFKVEPRPCVCVCVCVCVSMCVCVRVCV